MTIKSELDKLTEKDIYSLLLFALYKASSSEQFSTLSQLSFILDKESLLNLCEIYGGLTIKIPTIEELESIMYSLILYQYVNIDGMDYDEAVKIIGYKSSQLRKVKSDYFAICEILDKYDFRRDK